MIAYLIANTRHIISPEEYRAHNYKAKVLLYTKDNRLDSTLGYVEGKVFFNFNDMYKYLILKELPEVRVKINRENEIKEIEMPPVTNLIIGLEGEVEGLGCFKGDRLYMYGLAYKVLEGFIYD